VTQPAGEISVLAVFAVSRTAYFVAGLRFNARPVETFWQMIDPALMRTDLLRSLWYLHMQPPGYNLAIGLTVKLFPYQYATVLWVMQIAIGAAIAVCLFRLICRLGVPVSWACMLTSIFVISPGCVLFENDATYDYPVLLLLLLSALALSRFCESLTTRWALAFFGCLLVLMLVRNAFHVIYLLTVTVGLLWFLPVGRRAILTGVLPVLLILGGLYVKNGLLFGRFTSSTWLGMTMGMTTTYQLTDEEAADLVKRGVVSPLAEITPFSKLSEYDPYIHRPPKTGIPVLDQDVTSTGHPNFNHLAYLQVHDQYLADSIAIWRHYPIAYARSVAIECFSYFRPASDLEYFDKESVPIQAWERAFNAVVFGQVRHTEDREDFLELKDAGHNFSRVLYTGMFLVALIPATVTWGAAQLLVPRWRRRWTRTQLLVLGFILFTIIFVTLVSILFSTFDGNRYRFPLDGFFVALAGGMLVQMRGRRKPVHPSDFQHHHPA
jgi:hypothetical protein